MKPLNFLIAIPIKIVGSVVCAVFFGIAGIISGVAFPWTKP